MGTIDRRQALCRIGLLPSALLLPLERLGLAADSAPRRPKVAAIMTVFTFRSHAHVILENFLEPYLFDGELTDPGVDVVSFYVDQFPSGDMARDVAARYEIPIYPSIDKALCLGGDELAVDAVLAIGEHGDYPDNAKGQREYPRKQFFDQAAAVCQRAGRGVPYFNDKHLSYRWDWAKEMYDTAAKLKMPLMAGSSVPLAQRRPQLELPPQAPMTAALSVHGGGPESYDFHGLEVLQALVEGRKGGETGVKTVQFLEGDALWEAADRGAWSIPLAVAAMTAELGADHDMTRALTNRGRLSSGEPVPMHSILLDYRDGLRAAALKIGHSGTRFSFACQLTGEPQPRATNFYVGPWENRNLFKALSHAIQTHFRQGESPYPVERTLLTTGIVDAAMDSRQQGGRVVETPQLAVAYQAKDYRAMRETGASWKILTEGTPEPPGIHGSKR